MSAARSVRIRDVAKHYGAVPALRGVSLAVQPGTFCTLLGPSGSGKTTLLKLVAGFERPDAGAIEIDGRDVVAMPPAARNIGMVFQNYALFPHMTVGANVAFPLEMRRCAGAEIERRVAATLSLVALDGLAGRYPGQLSGGQQQRVALARAIVFDPDILLMDEPLGALDRSLRQQIQGELKALQRRLGVTVLYVTHDQEEALDLSDTIAVMRDGRIEQAGSPQGLYDLPATRFVAGFLGECNLLPARVLAGGREIVLALGAGVTLPWRGGSPAGEVTVGLRPERVRIAAAGEPGAIAGVLRGTVFTGADFRLTLAVGDRLLTVRHANRDFTPPAIGAPMALRIDAADLVPLSEGS